MKSFVYKINKKATSTVEKRIKSNVKNSNPFLLDTDVTGSMLSYFVDSGGWVHSHKEDEEEYQGVVGHVKNFLPFLGGPRTMAFDQPEKRKYTRRTVKRGLI